MADYTVRDDYGCDWREAWLYLRWRSIMDNVLRDMIRQAYMTVRLEHEISEMWKWQRRRR